MSDRPALIPPKRRTLGDDVADRIRDAIFNGEFAAGEHLREERLANELQVSRGPIRDALAALERDGLVVLTRHHGATVVELSREDLEEVYSLRTVLETLAARYAVKRATEADFERLTAALGEFTAGLANNPTERDAAELDVQFHDAFYIAAHHERLYVSWSNIRLQVYRFLLTRNLANPDWRENMARGHTEILDVLRSRDEEAMVSTVVTHIQYAYMRVVESFAPGEAGQELLAMTGVGTPGTAAKRVRNARAHGRS